MLALLNWHKWKNMLFFWNLAADQGRMRPDGIFPDGVGQCFKLSSVL